VLKGGLGADKLYGGKGKDLLVGGAQRDKLSGGPQKDTAKKPGPDLLRSIEIVVP
jgi:Ca2+-binding RTX toxin-like protein